MAAAVPAWRQREALEWAIGQAKDLVNGPSAYYRSGWQQDQDQRTVDALASVLESLDPDQNATMRRKADLFDACQEIAISAPGNEYDKLTLDSLRAILAAKP